MRSPLIKNVLFRRGITLVYFLFLFLETTFVQAQNINLTKGGKGLQFVSSDSTFSANLSARIQALYTGTMDVGNKKHTDEMQIRRARLKLEGFTLSPKLEYKIELALSNSDIGGNIQEQTNNTANIVLDAFLNYKVTDNLRLQFGQAKLPGNRERVISSQMLQFVDRSLLNNAYNIDRDLGLQLQCEVAAGKVIFREILAVTMGEGRNITTTNKGGHDYTGRMEVLPLGDFEEDGDYFGADLKREPTPKLAIGVSYDYNQKASREGGQLGSFLSQQRNLKTFFADAMFKYQGFSAMAEYADKETSGSPVVAREATGRVTESFFTGTGFNLQAGYLFKNNFEIAGRYTAINPEKLTERETNKQYTVGLSKYLLGHTVKVQSDVSLLNEQQNISEFMYRFQVEFGF